MGAFYAVWSGGIAVLLLFAALIGSRLRGTIWAIFIDARNTWSLSQFQLACWTLVGLPLIVATAVWRATEDAAGAWDFDIPGELLALMGISLGSAVTALAIKSSKENTRGRFIGARDSVDPTPPFVDMFAVEEGPNALKSLDITKFQNFIFTVSLLASYVWIVIRSYNDIESGVPSSLPDFSDAMIGLLALSHGGYLVGKLPNRDGDPTTPPTRAAAPGTAPQRVVNFAFLRRSVVGPDEPQ
jgi:hypothetical protein